MNIRKDKKVKIKLKYTNNYFANNLMKYTNTSTKYIVIVLDCSDRHIAVWRGEDEAAGGTWWTAGNELWVSITNDW